MRFGGRRLLRAAPALIPAGYRDGGDPVVPSPTDPLPRPRSAALSRPSRRRSIGRTWQGGYLPGGALGTQSGSSSES